MKNKRITKITAALNSMSKENITSLLLFALYKLRDNPDALTLSDLCYVIDGNNVARLLSYFGGMTITFPTLDDYILLQKALTLFAYVNSEGGDFEDGLKAVTDDKFTAEKIKEAYATLTEVLANYEFGE